MKYLFKLSLTPLALALSFPVAAEQSWSGSYFGAMLNQGNSSTKSDTTYSNNGASPPVGWSQNQFKGDLLNSIDSMQYTEDISYEGQNVSSVNLPFWESGGNQNQSITSGTLLTGKNIQSGNIVFGGEVRVTFGSFNSSSTQTNAGSGSKTMSDFEGATTITFTNYNSSLSGITSPTSVPYWPEHENLVAYTQTGTQQSGTKYNGLIQLMGRVGYSFGDVMIYGMGGVAYASIEANTAALINESATGAITYGATTLNYTGSTSYSFSGQTTKSMFGPSIGAGMEWAIQDNTSLRLEGQYYSLGKVSVKGISHQTSATYSVNQEISAYNISIGLIRKF